MLIHTPKFAHGTNLQVNDGTNSIQIKLGDTAIFYGDAMTLDIVAENSGAYYFVEATTI